MLQALHMLRKWEEAYGEKATPKVESMHEKLQRYQEKADKHNASEIIAPSIIKNYSHILFPQK